MQATPPPSSNAPDTSGVQNRLDSVKSFMNDLKTGINDVYKDLGDSTLLHVHKRKYVNVSYLPVWKLPSEVD